MKNVIIGKNKIVSWICRYLFVYTVLFTLIVGWYKNFWKMLNKSNQNRIDNKCKNFKQVWLRLLNYKLQNEINILLLELKIKKLFIMLLFSNFYFCFVLGPSFCICSWIIRWKFTGTYCLSIMYNFFWKREFWIVQLVDIFR